jgi:hypothetical protein
MKQPWFFAEDATDPAALAGGVLPGSALAQGCLFTQTGDQNAKP